MTVYLDELIIVNFILDYLLLWGAGLISSRKLCRWRIALGGVIGCGYALVCAVCGWRAVLWLPVRICVGVVMCFSAYGTRSWKTIGWFFALSGGMAGGVYALSVFGGGRVGFLSGAVYFRIPWLLLLVLAGAVWLGLTALARLPSVCRGRNGERVSATILCLNRVTEAEVFIDTGCFLRDPTDNSAVIVISRGLARELLPKNVTEAFDSGIDAEEALLLGGAHAPRLVFATGVGSAGALYAFTVSVSFNGGEMQRMTAAISPTLGAEGIQAIMGTDS